MRPTLPLCLSLALLASCAETSPSAAVPAADPAAASEIAALRADVAELTRAVERLQRRPQAAPATGADPDERARLDAALARIDALEASVTAANAAAHDASAADEASSLPALRDLVRRRRGPLAADELAATQRQAVDAGATAEERLRALRVLRGERDGRSREVVLSMIELARTSGDPRVRADVFRQLHRVTLPELEQPLLDALRGDADAKVREEAAETLDHFLGSDAVRSALAEAAESDADRGVREQARESLERR